MKGAALIALERYSEAAQSCTRALEIQPTHGAANMNMGAALWGLKRWELAIKAFRVAAQLGQPRADEAAAHCAQCALDESKNL